MLLEFPRGEPEGGQGRERKPGFTRSPHPAPRAAPSGGPAAPAGRKRSLCGCDSQGGPFSAGGRGESGCQRTSQVQGRCGGFPPGSRFLAAEGCAPAAAPLTPASARLRPPGEGRSSGASSSLGVPLPTLPPGAGQRGPRDLSTLRRPDPEQRGVGSRSPGAGVGAGHGGGAPRLPVSLRPPRRSYLSWRCTRRTTQPRSHPSASLPRAPEAGRAEARRNARGCRGARGSERPNLLAGGGGGGSAAPGAALGDRAQEGGPGRPAPRPPPHGGRRRCGAPTGPRCGCARLGAGAATPAGCAPRGGRAVPLRPLSCSRSPGAGVPGPAAQGEAGGAGRPLSQAPAQARWPRHCRRLSLGAAGGAPQVATDHPGRGEPRSPREGAFLRAEP